MPPLSDHSSSTLLLRTATEAAQTWIEVRRPNDSGQPLIAIPAGEPSPELPVEPGTFDHVVALDVLEAVLDEEAWLDAIATALRPGGTATIRVPLEGPMAWLDALNLYRYAQDITGVGKQLQETRLKGWHRHYRRKELRILLARHGFDVAGEDREGSPVLEAAQLGALVWGGMVQGSNAVEDTMRTWREDREDRRRLIRLGPLSTRIIVKAVKRS